MVFVLRNEMLSMNTLWKDRYADWFVSSSALIDLNISDFRRYPSDSYPAKLPSGAIGIFYLKVLDSLQCTIHAFLRALRTQTVWNIQSLLQWTCSLEMVH